MSYEVEQKFRLNDVAEMEQRLVDLGADFQPPIIQTDQYFAHPARDFGQTDEALRIRRVGDSAVITYKGPKIDQRTKTRREIEISLHDPGDHEQLLLALGFRRVAQVRKSRRRAEITWQDAPIEVALDDVDQVGAFLEMEIVADEDHVETAKEKILSLADQLQLTQPERRSYLEMLLENNASPQT